MKKHLAAFGLVAVLAGGLFAFEEKKPLKSGPQVNEELPGPFHPLNVNGPNAGNQFCLYCANGSNPVAMVFARATSPAVTKLITKIDEATNKNKDADMGSFFVFCSDEKGLSKKLEMLAKDTKISKCVLAIDEPAGPKRYNVSKEAEVTVVLYVDRTVKANFTFRKSELKDGDIEKILAALPTILPKK